MALPIGHTGVTAEQQPFEAISVFGVNSTILPLWGRIYENPSYPRV
tara:strand:- start:2658 stop:2795 length:138 start_codon:yes stop_codon:yes gene_type:complete